MYNLKEIRDRFGEKVVMHKLAYHLHKSEAQKVRHKMCYRFNLIIFLHLSVRIGRIAHEKAFKHNI